MSVLIADFYSQNNYVLGIALKKFFSWQFVSQSRSPKVRKNSLPSMNCLQVELNFNATANFRNAPELNIYTRC